MGKARRVIAKGPEPVRQGEGCHTGELPNRAGIDPV